MSAASPGARTWSARSTTATRAIGLALALAAGPAGATDAIDRILAAASSGRPIAPVVEQDLRRVCQDDALCAAARVAALLGDGARLEPVRHPDTDTIRWARTAPSVSVHEAAQGPGRIEIRRFGRKVLRELRAALDRSKAGDDGKAAGLTLDLQRNRGGDLERMLAVAGYLIGPRRKAVRLSGARGARWYRLEARGRPRLPVMKVLIGAGTASSAEVLAALLAVHAGAKLCGNAPTAGKDLAQSVVPVTHDWHLLVKRARIEVPGIELSGGLVPDRAC